MRASARDGSELFVTIIGRGASATRAIAGSLQRSRVDMGRTNVFLDKEPYEVMYGLGRLMCTQYMTRTGDRFDFTRAIEEPVPEAARCSLEEYLADRFSVPGPRGWKLPETTLILPWLVRVYPDLHYIYWTRGVWDLRNHLSDLLLVRWGVLSDRRDLLRLAAESWRLQYDIVEQTPKPARWIHVRMEDYVLEHERTKSRLEEFLGIELDMVPPKREAVTKASPLQYEFTLEPMRRLGYEV